MSMFEVRYKNDVRGVTIESDSPLHAALQFAKEEGLEQNEHYDSMEVEVRDLKNRSKFYKVKRKTYLECMEASDV